MKFAQRSKSKNSIFAVTCIALILVAACSSGSNDSKEESDNASTCIGAKQDTEPNS